ncbi:LysM peptidoglycan-binding domain-containing protein [Pontibacter qinzhouensis]|uniref:LysM peptidoglycan-binding domain-containing protein n=1 Tax=Pontibacter qinzhouensis TaxID=2603253 RepID=A0A5C8KEF4_9BACT|nr:LysM domain-containing protein [Pontibacter qinzhouensis]TXK51553.1 LysM peptidoglycan-binding domain-containing protein [Pontibacter qinzhouensis]
MRAITTFALLIFTFLVFVSTSSEAAPVALGAANVQQAAVSDSVYVVQQGDTYYSLSRRFNIPLDSLQQWNENKLQIGQTLYLTSRVAATQKKAGSGDNSQNQTVPAPATGDRATSQYTTGAGVNSTTASASPAPAATKTKSRIMVIPFDPYLYFSDADDEIAQKSRIPRPNIRYAFRNRLDALMASREYETIHLLGDVYRDSVNEMSSVYKSLHYSYQDNKQSKYNRQPAVNTNDKQSPTDWLKKQKEKITNKEAGPTPVAKDQSKHYGVTVKDASFFDRYNSAYDIDYYVFINQFEVKTIYENCLDRAAQNYQRDFLVHYSIYDSSGKLISGNKVNVPYESNINDVQRIVSDTMPSMARRVMADLPPAE